jgi:multidrug resistance efflux pump
MSIIRRIIFIVVLLVIVGLLAALGYRYWYQPTYDFLNTDDANVTGSLVRIAAPASGQINDLYVDTGQTINKNDTLATIKVVSTAPAVLGVPSVPRVLARVTSPVTGTVAARNVSVGDTVAAGQVLATIVDENSLWVVVNVLENRVAELKPGMVADVTISSVNHTFRGTVTDIGSATTDVAGVLNPLNLSSTNNTDKKIPVKVVFDHAGYRLASGMSASVLVYTHVAPK